MNLVLEAVAEALATAADREAGRRARGHRRGRIATMVAAGGLTLGGAVAVAATIWAPQIGTARLGHPTASASPPPADQLAHLGVLRRAATDADHGVQATYALRWLDLNLRGVRTGYVRLLGIQPDGMGFVLVPAQFFSPTATPDALCLFRADTEGGGMACFTTAQLLAGQAMLLTEKVTMVKVARGSRPAGHRPPARMPDGSLAPERPASTLAGSRFFGLVPDGVASVRLENDLGSVTVPVRNNFFQAPMPTDAAHANGAPQAADQPTFHWLDGAGAEVPKAIAPPRTRCEPTPHECLSSTEALARRPVKPMSSALRPPPRAQRERRPNFSRRRR